MCTWLGSVGMCRDVSQYCVYLHRKFPKGNMLSVIASSIATLVDCRPKCLSSLVCWLRLHGWTSPVMEYCGVVIAWKWVRTHKRLPGFYSRDFRCLFIGGFRFTPERLWDSWKDIVIRYQVAGVFFGNNEGSVASLLLYSGFAEMCHHLNWFFWRGPKRDNVWDWICFKMNKTCVAKACNWGLFACHVAMVNRLHGWNGWTPLGTQT